MIFDVVMDVKRWLFQLALFLGLLLLVEVYLRIQGHRPGLLTNAIHPVDTLIYQPRFKADSTGMVSYLRNSPYLPEGYVINK